MLAIKIGNLDRAYRRAQAETEITVQVVHRQRGTSWTTMRTTMIDIDADGTSGVSLFAGD
jgi:hypothetical protein